MWYAFVVLWHAGASINPSTFSHRIYYIFGVYILMSYIYLMYQCICLNCNVSLGDFYNVISFTLFHVVWYDFIYLYRYGVPKWYLHSIFIKYRGPIECNWQSDWIRIVRRHTSQHECLLHVQLSLCKQRSASLDNFEFLKRKPQPLDIFSSNEDLETTFWTPLQVLIKSLTM